MATDESVEPLRRQTLTITEACKAARVTRRTIYNWMTSGKVQFVRTPTGSARIYADTLWQKPDTEKHDETGT